MNIDIITVSKCRARLALASLLTALCLAAGVAAMPLGSPVLFMADTAQPSATPDPDEVLTDESAGALIEEYKAALNAVLKDDEVKVLSITEKWDASELVGKTRGQ